MYFPRCQEAFGLGEWRHGPQAGWALSFPFEEVELVYQLDHV